MFAQSNCSCHSLRSNRIETEGHLLDGAHVKVYTYDDNIKEEFANGSSDNIWQIHKIPSNKLLNEHHPAIDS